MCDDTGSITWQQPVRDADGLVVLTEMSHPCVRGCSGWRKMPAAEQGTVVDDPDAAPLRTSNVARANLHHRTDWSQPRRL
ncbi:hypothetical protein [Saccharothrix sp. ALI-22-I]|uniref:hypothetical protein n=1 Tax=Saccharothrix sp. ALI-22-I TaxID=1933778 RepID=UPI0015C34A86|nr:hypothetical protein [Saccharothrix sp. ALI-22-I]